MDVRMCSKCSQSIPAQRLTVLPETRHCVGCSCVKCKTELEVDLDGPELDGLVRATRDVPSGE